MNLNFILIVACSLVQISHQQSNTVKDRMYTYFASKFSRGLELTEEPQKCQVSWNNAKVELRDNARGEHELVIILEQLGAKMHHKNQFSLLKQFNEDCVGVITDSLNQMMADTPKVSDQLQRGEDKSGSVGTETVVSDVEVPKLRLQVLNLQNKLDFAVVKLKMLLLKLESSMRHDSASPKLEECKPSETLEANAAFKVDETSEKELRKCMFKLEAREMKIDKLNKKIKDLNKDLVKKEESYNKAIEQHKNSIDLIKSTLNNREAEQRRYRKDNSNQDKWKTHIIPVTYFN